MTTRKHMLIALTIGLVAIAPAGASAQDEPVASFFEVNPRGSGPPIETGPTITDDGFEMFTIRFENVAVDAEDPRASGVGTLERTETSFEVADGLMVIGRSSYRIVNDEGAWAGTGSIALSAQGGPPTQLAATFRMDGEGAYEGLILELHGEEPDEFMNEVWWGVIYPAEAVPAQPEPIQAG